MDISNYKKTIEEYIAKKESTNVSKESARGLLAPKGNVPSKSSDMPKADKGQGAIIANVAEFVYALRKKRQELTAKRTKKNGS